jgi:hypothetical protein
LRSQETLLDHNGTATLLLLLQKKVGNSNRHEPSCRLIYDFKKAGMDTPGNLLLATSSKLAGRFLRALGERLDELIPGPASDGSVDLEFRVGSKSLFVTMYEGQDPTYVLVDGDDIERTNGSADNTTINRLCSRLISGLPSV